jgi:hypothetical protein
VWGNLVFSLQYRRHRARTAVGLGRGDGAWRKHERNGTRSLAHYRLLVVRRHGVVGDLVLSLTSQYLTGLLCRLGSPPHDGLFVRVKSCVETLHTALKQLKGALGSTYSIGTSRRLL